MARYLRPRITDAKVLSVRTTDHEKWASARAAQGLRIFEVRRRGKHLLLDLEGDETLAVHLGMTGVVELHGHQGALPAPHRHERVLLHLDGGRRGAHLFRLIDSRGFGHAVMARRDERGTPELAALQAMGPEPLDDWEPAHLIAACARRSGAIKAALLDQSVVAGVGNYLADEILFASGIHPATAANALGARRLRRLHREAQRIIAAAVEDGGASISDYRHPDGSIGEAQWGLLAYGREGEPCARCGRPLRKSVVAGRGTTYCSHCQRR